MFHQADTVSLAAFLLLCVVVVAAFVVGAGVGVPRGNGLRARRMGLASIIAMTWIIAISLWVQSGWVEASPVPRLMVFFAVINLTSLGIGLSPIGRWLAQGVSIKWLVAFQGFRLPLEVILHSWVNQGTIPSTMTWTGSNWDIISGIVALAAAPFAHRSRLIPWFANGVGILLLLNVARVAIFSSPLPFAWQTTPPLQLAFHWPYALILPICVGGAIIGHVALTRALLAKS